jgi:hypothetical protein
MGNVKRRRASMSCGDKSCGHEMHSHGHAHGHASCSCCCHQQCQCDCHKQQHKYADELLRLADEAWMEVVKEKIKEEIRQNSGEHLKQLAQLVAASNQKRWSEKLSEKKNHDDFEGQLKNLIYRQSKS